MPRPTPRTNAQPTHCYTDDGGNVVVNVPREFARTLEHELNVQTMLVKHWQAQFDLVSRQWQPIETAPMDGTEVLIWEDGLIRIAAYDTTGKCWWVFRQGQFYPTHWQPLPPAP